MEPHLAAAIEAAGGTVPKPNKFGAVRTGRYDSKAEARYAQQLDNRKRAPNGDVLDWLEQVPIRLSGCTYRVDFLVFLRDGTWKFVEVKGHWTPLAKQKMRQLQLERPELAARLEVVS